MKRASILLTSVAYATEEILEQALPGLSRPENEISKDSFKIPFENKDQDALGLPESDAKSLQNLDDILNESSVPQVKDRRHPLAKLGNIDVTNKLMNWKQRFAPSPENDPRVSDPSKAKQVCIPGLGCKDRKRDWFLGLKETIMPSEANDPRLAKDAQPEVCLGGKCFKRKRDVDWSWNVLKDLPELFKKKPAKNYTTGKPFEGTKVTQKQVMTCLDQHGTVQEKNYIDLLKAQTACSKMNKSKADPARRFVPLSELQPFYERCQLAGAARQIESQKQNAPSSTFEQVFPSMAEGANCALNRIYDAVTTGTWGTVKKDTNLHDAVQNFSGDDTLFQVTEKPKDGSEALTYAVENWMASHTPNNGSPSFTDCGRFNTLKKMCDTTSKDPFCNVIAKNPPTGCTLEKQK